MLLCGSASLYMLYYYNILLAPRLLASADHPWQAAFTESGDYFMSTVDQISFGKGLSTQLWIRKTPCIKGFERRLTASLNSPLPVSMNLSLLLNKAHHENVRLKAQAHDNVEGMPSYDIMKHSSSTAENVFTVDCLFLLIWVINTEILEVPNSRSTPHGYVNSNP